VKEGTFRRGALRRNPSARTQLFAADRRTSSKKEETLRRPTEAPEETKKQLLPDRLVEDRELAAPTAANRAPVLMPALSVAIAQKDHCHLVGHLRMPRAR